MILECINDDDSISDEGVRILDDTLGRLYMSRAGLERLLTVVVAIVRAVAYLLHMAGNALV